VRPALRLSESACHEALKGRGLLLRVNHLQGGAEHWMVETEAGQRVLDYWPARGRWWCPKLSRKGVQRDEPGLIELAVRLAIELGA
jgi:hypothetical protein